MKSDKFINSLDHRLVALVVGIGLIVLSSVVIAGGYLVYVVLGIISVGVLLFFLRDPALPMTVLFPLIWLFWSYNTPLLGGRLERIIGILAILGVVLVARRRTFRPLPVSIWGGLGLLLGGYTLSSVLHFTSVSIENIISLAMRLVFLYLAYFHVSKGQQLRLVAKLLIITGILGGGIILIWNLQWGLGFFRTYEGNKLAQTALGPFWFSLLLGGNSLTIAAILLLGLYPGLRTSSQRFWALTGIGFLFAMAFIAQFRREIIITAAVLLIYLMAVNYGGLRRAAFWVILGLIAFYLLVLQPSAIFQERLSETYQISVGSDPRLLSLRAGLQAFVQSPIIGTGPGSYDSVTYGILGPGYPSFYYHAYNVFVYFAVEAGLVGLGGLLIILGGVYVQVQKFRPQIDTSEGWLLRSAPALLLGISVSFLFGNYYEMSLPWYIMGLLLAASRLVQENRLRESV